MAVLIDTHAGPARPRHPEKAHRPDQPVLAKPDWIRVKAPVSAGYLETTEEELMHTVFPHPTLSEMMKEAVLDAYGRVLNM